MDRTPPPLHHHHNKKQGSTCRHVYVARAILILVKGSLLIWVYNWLVKGELQDDLLTLFVGCVHE